MILLHLAALCLGNVTVTLPTEAEARGTELTVDTICSLAGDDPAAVERVAALSLGYAPAPGHTRLFDAWRLQQDLRRAAPDLDVRVVGARACRVSPATEIVAGSQIEDIARAELERQLEGLDAEARPVGAVADVRVPAGQAGSGGAELRSVLAPDQGRAGNLSVPVRILVDGDVSRTIWTRWEVDLWARYQVLMHAVPAGARIGGAMLEMRRLEASAANARPGARVLGRALLVGALAARDLDAGRPLTDLDVVRPTLVRSGDTTFLEVRKGAIHARVGAVAGEDGALGDRITVTLQGSGRQMRAVVLSRDLVRIDLSAAE
jgi:flagella basal body P-ring formation protein FlgA